MGPAPSPVRRNHSLMQPTSTSPGTTPLGMGRREQAAPSPRGLRDGMTAWRLKMSFGRRPEAAVADVEGGSSCLSTIEERRRERAPRRSTATPLVQLQPHASRHAIANKHARLPGRLPHSSLLLRQRGPCRSTGGSIKCPDRSFLRFPRVRAYAWAHG